MRYVPGRNTIPRNMEDGYAIVLNDRGEPAFLAEGGDGERLVHPCSRFPDFGEWALYLGLWRGLSLHVWELTKTGALPDGMEFVSLRSMLPGLSEDETAALCQAKQLIHWEATNRFCGVCGNVMKSSEEERALQCTQCAHIVYPRITPAVIVAVTRGDELLLVQNHRHRGNMYSLVAGYVETGETLEEAVAREVMEETGVEISSIRYFGSQCWPFPSTMMIGFTAAYRRGEIVPEAGEIADAGWFVPGNFPEIPGHGSISRELIDAYVRSMQG